MVVCQFNVKSNLCSYPGVVWSIPCLVIVSIVGSQFDLTPSCMIVRSVRGQFNFAPPHIIVRSVDGHCWPLDSVPPSLVLHVAAEQSHRDDKEN